MGANLVKYECHITCDYVPPGTVRQEFIDIAATYMFRPAKLMVARDVESTEDTFCTGHGDVLDAMKVRANLCGLALENAGFVVRRVKIEEILMDSRVGWNWRSLQ